MIKKYLTWDDFFELLIPVQDKITPDDIVFGIPKGGMIVSNFLECKKQNNICTFSWYSQLVS